MSASVSFRVAGRETEGQRHQVCRRMLVGPWCNQPDEYPGYNGFVGWMALTTLRSGRWLMTFSSGYWHASFPLTKELLKDEANRKFFADMQKYGCPFLEAERGGRGHIMHSDDQGATWSKPTLLVDTALDDRHPSILEMDDGAWLCTYFDYEMPGAVGNYHARYMISTDCGATWSQEMTLPGIGGGFCANPAIQLSDGTVVWVAEGQYDPSFEHNVIGVFRSSDRGRTFTMAGVVSADHEMNEPTIVEFPDRRLMMITRPKSDISFSSDGGRTWTSPVSIGVGLVDPHVVLLPNGVLACFYGAGGVRVILSKDFGVTWHGPKETCGYSVDPSVYGYSAPMVLSDGTVYLAYIHSGGHAAADARTAAIWGVRVKVNDSADGIEILPAPGSPADRGLALTGLESLVTHGGDLSLGELKRS